MNRLPLPISQHKRDIVFVAFFVVNLLFVTYIIDIEQNIIADPSHLRIRLCIGSDEHPFARSPEEV